MKKIALIILLAVGSLVGLFKLQTEVHVERFAVIEAPIEVVRLELTDFRKFVKWSPWSDIDPEVTYQFSPKQGQLGAKLMWSGNDHVGVGFQEVKSVQADHVEVKLVVTAPWQAESRMYYHLVPTEEGTVLTWGYVGQTPLLVDWIQSADKTLGIQYEIGLKRLQNKYRK